MSWQTGLIKTILDPKNLLISTDVAVVIADKFPKAHHHYLVLPKEDIASIFQLRKHHLPLLEELHLLALNIIEVRGESLSNFKIGFHAEPSMQRLHLHVISLDFVSSSLKTKKHWNSFNTSLFVPYDTIYDRLNKEGCIERLPKDKLKELLDTPLTCNQCEFVAKNIPTLKEHLQDHYGLDMNRKEFCKYNLARQMEKKLDFLIETEQAAVMKDAYPKAQYHFLVVAKEQISGVTKLTRDHLPLLDHMMELANQIIEQQHHLPPDNFLVGFKIDAFMNSLCMHVISDDFYSISMRKLKHWNSFNTDLFLTYQAVYALLRLQGSIESMFDEKALELRETKQLHCNQCDFECDSLLFLKAHLHEHWKKREDDFEVKKQVEQITKMLDDSKLSESPTKIPQVEEEAKSKTVSTNWRQNPEQKSTNNEFDTKVPTTNWRQNKNQSVTEQTPIVAYQNEFAKHFQKSMERQQQRQQAVNAMQGQGLMGPRPPCVPPPYYAQQAQAFRPRLPHMVNNSINQMQSTDSPPHFNPFRQPPNMGQVGPNPYNIRNGSLPQNINFERKPNWTPRPQYNQGQNKFKNAREVNSTPIEKKPNDAMENKPNAKPKPQYNQAQNRPNNTRDNSTPMTTQPNDAMENKPKWKGKPQHKQGQNKNVNNNQPNAGPSNKPNWKPKPSNTSPNVPKQTQPDQKQNNPNSANSQTPN